MRYAVEIEKKSYAVELPDSFFSGKKRHLVLEGKAYTLETSHVHGVVVLTDECGMERMLRLRRTVREKFDGESNTKVSLELLVSAAVGFQRVELAVGPDVPGQAQRAKQAGSGDLVVRSQITGKVLAVEVKAGDHVSHGQTLAIIEAMKMENRIFAAADGNVLSVGIKAGDSVATGRELFKIKRSAD